MILSQNLKNATSVAETALQGYFYRFVLNQLFLKISMPGRDCLSLER
jgi:hypothetical protein